ncbi:hypothetical protein AOLI_G00132190 [Acnodon oligacanthus]
MTAINGASATPSLHTQAVLLDRRGQTVTVGLLARTEKMASPQPGSPPTEEQDTPPPPETNEEKEDTAEQPPRRRGKGRATKSQHTFKCSACQEAFFSPSTLRSHKLLAHGKEKQQPYCGKMFSDPSSFRRHQRAHQGFKPYPCDKCNKRFRQPADLAVHQRVHSGQRPYKCQNCDKAFVASWDLRRHMLVHTGLRPFSCTECGKSFAERSSLNKHRRVHSGERPFKCQLCFKSFVVSSSLRKHERTHLAERPLQQQDPVPESAQLFSQNASPQFSCSHCDVLFGTWEELQAHASLYSISPTSDSTATSLNIGPYVCVTCQVEFTQMSALQAHEKMHPKPRPHVCDDCGKGFLNKAGLRKHQRIHSTSRPHCCTICGKAFLFAAYLRKHSRTHRDSESSLALPQTDIAHTQPLPSPPSAASPTGSEPPSISLTVPVTVAVSAFQTMSAHVYIDKEEEL